LQIDLLVAEFS